MDILLAIKDLNERKEITNIQNNLSANENNIQSLLLIYTNEHPKVKQAYELNQSLKHQMKPHPLLDCSDCLHKCKFSDPLH